VIVQERGRWKTRRTQKERRKIASSALDNLSAEERHAAEVMVSQLMSQGHSPVADAAAQSEWEEIPLPPRQWVNDKHYVGDTADTLYPILKNDLVRLFEGNYSEVLLTGSIGWGKDYFGTLALMRVLYELNCYKNPARSLGLGAGEKIHIVIVSRTAEHARRVGFTGLKQKLALSPWFKGRYKETEDHIKFPGKDIFIVGAASSEASALGFNVYAALVDEVNFHGTVTQKHKKASAGGATLDRAQMIYDGLVRRVKSRYQAADAKGMVFLVSSKRTTTDFTERRIKEAIAKDHAEGMFVLDYATWDVRPEAFINQTWHTGVVNTTEGKVRVLSPDEEPAEGDLAFDFPDSYLMEFERDPAGAARDVAGIATDAFSPFISARGLIVEMFDPRLEQVFAYREWECGRPLPIRWSAVTTINARNEKIPLYNSSSPRHVHLDLSKNQCATGFTMAHQTGMIEMKRTDEETGMETIEEVPTFQVDAVLRIVAPAAGEIDHEMVRDVVWRLIEGGFNIRSVSMDLWMSTPNEQQFKKKGLRTEVISTVRKMEPYIEARNLIYEGRVTSPQHDGLLDELARIELEERGLTRRVIAPPGVTKDLADSFAGALYYLSKNTKGGVVLAPSRAHQASPQFEGPRWTDDGDVQWEDERGFDSDDSKGGDGAWIIT